MAVDDQAAAPGAHASEGAASDRAGRGGLMAGKRALVTGVANDRSIAWAIADRFHAEGAELAFTYQGEGMARHVRPLVSPIARAVIDCDVARDDDIDRTARELSQVWDRLDVLVHSIAYAPRPALDGRFVDATSREAWRVALDVSAYSLVALARALKPLMRPGSSIVTLTYYGAEKVVTHYNVMGVAKAALEASVRYLASELGPDNIRVNAISAGPIKTLAAMGIKDFSSIREVYSLRTPLRRNVELGEVADTATFLFSAAARGITGEIVMVDAGYHVTGM